MPDKRRETQHEELQAAQSPEERAVCEAKNGIRQFYEVKRLIKQAISEKAFRFKTATILRLHKKALEGIYSWAGSYRNNSVSINGSAHQPPPWEDVPDCISELCQYVNSNWQEKSAIHLAAYVMWRLNWIHPFKDGNGRTSRAVSYYILSVRLGLDIPGVKTIPEQIELNRKPYYEALVKADNAFSKNKIDVSAMEELLNSYALIQLESQLMDPAPLVRPDRGLNDNLSPSEANRKNVFAVFPPAVLAAIAVILAALIGAFALLYNGYLDRSVPECSSTETKQCEEKCESSGEFQTKTCVDETWGPCSCDN